MTCPICHKELPAGADRESPLFPFCSQRCKQVDFFRWTEGRYSIVEPLIGGVSIPDAESIRDADIEAPP